MSPAPLPMKMPPVEIILPLELINAAPTTFADTLPVVLIVPNALILPPVIVPVVVIGPVRLTKLPVYVGRYAATLALL